MKKLTLLFLLFVKFGFAQQLTNQIIYLDSLNNGANPEEYKYYRIVNDYFLDKKEYRFTQYYNSDKIQSKGITANKDNLLLVGEYTTYWENGSIQAKTNFEKYKPIGLNEQWYENGSKKIEKQYFEEKSKVKYKILNYWDNQNNQKVIDGNGVYKDSIINRFNGNSKWISQGQIVNGLKEGVWKGECKKLGISFEENYKDGELISGVSTNINNEMFTYTDANSDVEAIPNLSDFYNYLGRKFDISEEITKKETLIISFNIDTEGKLTDVKFIKGITEDLNQKFLKILNKYTDFRPAIYKGIKMKYNYRIPIIIYPIEYRD